MLKITKGIQLNIDRQGTIAMGPAYSWDNSANTVWLWLTFQGAASACSGLVVNVSHIKKAMREILSQGAHSCKNWPDLLDWAYKMMADKFQACDLTKAQLMINDNFQLEINYKEPDMVLVTTKYELAVAHRLYNPQWSDEKNYDEFGKCANPAGHGHNYIVEVTIAGNPDPTTGQVANISQIEKIVNDNIVEPFDHKNMNADNCEFDSIRPTVENMSMVFWNILKDKFDGVELHKIKVWETPTTFAEYWE
ncbi:MAG: 6-carboxytetrahydropterin synthase [Phycisphaerae bacterium]|nr:6-carboxytetrahydropterin synthase [Phycisphaerae bacterium]